MVSYDYVSDDDEPRDEEESEDSNGKQDTEDNRSNSSSAVLLHPAGESDMTQGEINIHNDPTIVTSDLLNVTPVCILYPCYLDLTFFFLVPSSNQKKHHLHTLLN